ncbi:hypothetical protein, partial [Embleya sp. NPDC005575]|uniref:hypothetical protein n=1 Tax=Embleya sp. NPDC005575 TaxID=3156892 RepID=UPI0033BD4C89
MAGACLKAALHPIVVLVDSTRDRAPHALLGVWVRDDDGDPANPSGVWHSPPPGWDRLTRPHLPAAGPHSHTAAATAPRPGAVA